MQRDWLDNPPRLMYRYTAGRIGWYKVRAHTLQVTALARTTLRSSHSSHNETTPLAINIIVLMLLRLANTRSNYNSHNISPHPMSTHPRTSLHHAINRSLSACFSHSPPPLNDASSGKRTQLLMLKERCNIIHEQRLIRARLLPITCCRTTWLF